MTLDTPMTQRNERRLPADRRAEILTCALKLAVKHGYKNVSREALATSCAIAPSLISHHFGTMIEFRRTLMRYAITEGNAPVVLQGLADGNPYARKAPEALRSLALGSVS